jgi:hypothetical protein
MCGIAQWNPIERDMTLALMEADMDAMTAEDQIDPLMIAERWMLEGREVAIATVVATWGSAPRPVGSHLVIDDEGNFTARFQEAASRARLFPKRQP